MKLPDLRNLGICLRILVLVNLMALTAAILHANTLREILLQLAELSALIQPILLVLLILLYALYPNLRKLSYRLSNGLVLAFALTITLCVHSMAIQILGADALPPLWRALVLAAIMTVIVLTYFNLRQRALTPAIAEARLQALQARIRPHFLFNSLNAVLYLVRSDPKRAETALEDMADLFRVLMADNRDLVPLAQEIALSRQYLALEKIRLEERLNVLWQIDNMPPDALIPPLLLQPLIENAVYHGIEPLPDGGEIVIHIYASRKEIHLVLSNPYLPKNRHHGGNKMALGNIRERLALHFDAEAQLTMQTTDKRYAVHIVIPYAPHKTA